MSDKKIPYVIQYPADYAGCGFWRLLWPEFLLNMKNLATVSHTHIFLRDLHHYTSVKAIHIARQTNHYQYNFLKKIEHIRSRHNFRLIYDIDDIIVGEDIPDYNYAKKTFVNEPNFSIDIMQMCDEITVSTQFLRDYYRAKTEHPNISVIPNSIPYFWMGYYHNEELILRNYRRHKNKPRILYAGSANHFFSEYCSPNTLDDFSHVREAILKNMHKYKFVFVGAMPLCLKDEIIKGNIEFYDWKTMDVYPNFLANLEINMWIAPLADNVFNKAKSDLKFLEASALGLPIACQDLCTYAVAPIRFQTGEQMIQKLDQTLENEEVFIKASRKGRELIQGRWLENPENIGKYLDIYQYSYGDPRRKYV
jgi:hypothetical protein